MRQKSILENRRSPHGIVANMMDSNITVSKNLNYAIVFTFGLILLGKI